MRNAKDGSVVDIIVKLGVGIVLALVVCVLTYVK